MAAYVQMLLPLLWALIAQGHFVHQESSHFSSSHETEKLHGSGGDDVHTIFSPLNPDLVISPSHDRPITGDVYSYNNHHSYDDYYHDSHGNPSGFAYFEYPRFDSQRFENPPYGFPYIDNGYNGFRHPSKDDNIIKPYVNPSKHDNSGEEKHEDKDNKHNNNKEQNDNKDKSKTDLNKKSDNTSPQQNKINNDDGSGNKNSTPLKAKKDFLLVGSNGNGLYLLHENNPNPNTIVLPNSNQPSSNNVLYVPYNPQQPSNQVYQVVGGQPPITSSIPMSANRLNLNTPVANNVPANNNNPSYVLIYANGQLIKIPGIVVNPQQVGAPVQTGNPNVVYVSQPSQGNNPQQNGVPVQAGNPNVVYVSQPSQGSSPQQNGAPAQTGNPNVVYVSQPSQGNSPQQNGVPAQTGNPNVVYVSQPSQGSNPVPVQNPIYLLQPNQPTFPSQPATSVPTNMPNVYIRPNGMYNVANPLNVNPAVPVNTNGIHPNGMYNIANPLNVKPSVPANNQPAQPNGMYNVGSSSNGNPSAPVNNQPVPVYTVPVNNNQAQPPVQEKANAGTPEPNNGPNPAPAPVNNPQPLNPPATQAPEPSTNIMGIQPAVMVAGFKENDDSKGKKKDENEIKKDKDDKKVAGEK